MIVKSRKCKKGFTLIEVMVVMLMVAVAMAITAPIMTQRKTDSDDSPWKFAKDRSGDAYFNEDGTHVFIGDKDTCNENNSTCAKLMLMATKQKNSKNYFPIVFKSQNGNKIGLYQDGNSFHPLQYIAYSGTAV